MKQLTVLELLQAGVHFGHQKSRWHPKMREFIFAERGGIHILDLEKTLKKLKEATDFVSKVAERGGVVLFVGTKKQGQAIIEKYAKECGMPMITERWIGGLFTNFGNVGKLIRKYKKLIEEKESGVFAKYTKKEQSELGKEIERLAKIVGGLGDMRKIPEAVFILDPKREKTALTESKKLKVPVIATADSNINPGTLTFPIPANDDAVKSIELIVSQIAEAVKEGKAKAKKIV